MKSPAANGGWAKAYRRRWHHAMFRTKQEAAVFAWMCDDAAHEALTVKTKYGPVHLKRGEILISQRTIAADFGMSHKRVRSLLSRMESGGTVGAPMLTLSRAHTDDRAGTIATVLNYNKYQDISAQHQLSIDPTQTPPGHSAGHTRGTRGAQEQDKEEGKKEDPPPIVPPPCQNERDFERFWKAYPSREGAPNPKKPAREKFLRKVRDGIPVEDIIRGAEGFAASVARRREKEGARFDAAGAVCQALTFINQDRWEQYVDQADAPLTDEQRAVLARHNGGKRACSAERNPDDILPDIPGFLKREPPTGKQAAEAEG